MTIEELVQIPRALGIASQAMDSAYADAAFEALEEPIFTLRAGNGPALLDVCPERYRVRR